MMVGTAAKWEVDCCVHGYHIYKTPKMKNGNQYLLTLMCASTRFPEAISLRNIKAPTIVKHLVKFLP